MHTSFSHRLVQTPPSSWPASDSTWPHVFSFGRASLCCCCCCCAAHLVNGRRYDRDSCATAGVPKVCATEMGCEFTFLMLHFAFVIVAVFGFFFRDSSRLFWSFSSGSSDPNRHNMHTYTPIARRKSWNLMCIHRERMMRVCVCLFGHQITLCWLLLCLYRAERMLQSTQNHLSVGMFWVVCFESSPKWNEK